jgi:hypothetical protein
MVCFLMKNMNTGVAEIVAAGGRNLENNVILNTVEIFNMETMEWRTAGKVSLVLENN